MKQIAQIFSAISICIALAGCGKTEGKGAAITSTVVERDSGRVSLETLYCYSGANDKIAFAIFTDINSENAVSTVAGSWEGHTALEGGDGKPVLTFKGSPEAIEINGTRYQFSDGRVFLVSHQDGKLTAKQLDLPITDADRKDEITRLSEEQEVRDFLKK